jgi:hypothetical protein
MTNLVPLNSSDSKESKGTKIFEIGQVWAKLWPLSHGWTKLPGELHSPTQIR